MTLNEYQKLAARTMNPSLSRKELKLHALHGLCAEVGELNGIYQKSYQGHQVDIDHVVKELGDILWMLAELCTVIGVDMDEVAKTNINKLRKRYPDGFEAERSIHRLEGDV